MAKRTQTSKGMRIRLRTALKAVESQVSVVNSIKAQLLYRDNTIMDLSNKVADLTEQVRALNKEQTPKENQDESTERGSDSETDS